MTRNGRDFVVLLSKADLDSLEATLELLADSEAQRRVAEAEADVANGELVSASEMAQLMEQRRLASGT